MAEVTKTRSTRRCPPPPTPYPWLVYFHGKNMKNQTFYCLSEPNKTYAKSIPELHGREVWLSCHGWLVLADDLLHLWNPVTLQSIDLLPFKMQPKQYIKEILLTSAPSNPDSTLLLFVHDPRCIMFCCIKDRTWITRGYDSDIKEQSDYASDHFCQPVIFKNRIYASTFHRSHLVELEIVDSTRLIIRPLQCPPFHIQFLWPFSATYVVESCEDVFKIQVEHGGVQYGEIISIVLLKLDLSNMDWSKVESCPNRAFFLSHREAISCSVTSVDADRIGNRVYFILDHDKSLYCYHIKEKTISISLPCPDIPTPWKTPVWVLPDAQAETEYRQLNAEEDCGKEEDTKVGGNGADNISEENISEANRTTLLDDLPTDIVRKISSHLMPCTYLSFRAVSRGCRSVAPPRQWRLLSESVELENSILSPWLMLPEKEKKVSSFVDPSFGVNCEYLVTIPQELEDAKIRYSKYGWLLLSTDRFEVDLRRNRRYLKLYNPLTKSVIPLPELDPQDHYFFASLPGDSDCVVVAISFLPPTVFLIRPGMTEWIEIELIQEEDDSRFEPTHVYPVFFNNSFYFLGQKGDIGVIRLEESYATLTVHQLKRPCSSYKQNFLAECLGDILSVFVGKAGEWVQVFKLNQSKMVWEKVKDLGSNSLYVCGVSTIATQAKAPEMENKIYFPRFHGKSIMYYSFETGRFHSSGTKDSFMDYYGSIEQTSCCWIQPRWHSGESAQSSSLALDNLIRNNL